MEIKTKMEIEMEMEMEMEIETETETDIDIGRETKMGVERATRNLILNDMYIEHLKSVLKNDDLKLIEEEEITKEKIKNKEINKKEIKKKKIKKEENDKDKETDINTKNIRQEFDDLDELDYEKIEHVRSTLSTNCRIIKIKNEECEIAEWNKVEKNTPIDEHIIKRLIENLGFTKFLPCQSSILKYALLYKDGSNSLLNGDIYIEVPTGLGKTLCYIIPVVDYFLYTRDKNLFCIILTASDELVNQILHIIRQLDIKDMICKSLNMNKCLSNIYFDESIVDYLKNCNILITTTYKFEVLFYNNEELFKNLKYLVIDEVDRLLSFNKSNINTLLNTLTNIVQKYQMENTFLYRSKYFLQKFLVSATMCNVSDNIMSLQLFRPIFFYQTISDSRNDEFYCFANTRCHKMCIVIKLLLEMSEKERKSLSMLIFCENEESMHYLFRYLTVYFSYVNKEFFNMKAYSVHLTKYKKKKIFQHFLNGEINILICTDIISRGVDTVNANFLINFDIPAHYNTLTHRIGRVTRGDTGGTVYHLLKENEEKIMYQSCEQRKFKNLKKRDFDEMDINHIKENIMHIKPAIKSIIKLENMDILKRHRYYGYKDLLKRMKI